MSHSHRHEHPQHPEPPKPEHQDPLEKIAKYLKEIAYWLRTLAGEFVKAKSATLTILDEQGDRLMPAQLTVGQGFTSLYQEFSGLNGTGSPLAPAGPPAFSSSDPTVATVDPVTGVGVAVGPGTATITGSDSVNGLSASDTVSDQPIVAQSATLVVTAS